MMGSNLESFYHSPGSEKQIIQKPQLQINNHHTVLNNASYGSQSGGDKKRTPMPWQGGQLLWPMAVALPGLGASCVSQTKLIWHSSLRGMVKGNRRGLGLSLGGTELTSGEWYERDLLSAASPASGLQWSKINLGSLQAL